MKGLKIRFHGSLDTYGDSGDTFWSFFGGWVEVFIGAEVEEEKGWWWAE